MVLGIVMPPHIFEAGLRVNTNIYLDVVTNVVKPWMDGVGGEAVNLAAGQDARPHLQEGSGVVQGQPPVNRSPHSTKQSLISSIKEVFSLIPREDLRFRSRLEEVVAVEADFIH